MRGSAVRRRFAREPSSIHHRSDDLAIAGAAAEDAAQGILGFGLGWIGVAVQKRCRRDEQAGCADAALRRAMVEERGLQRRQSAVGETLDRGHHGASGRSRRHQAGADGFAVDKHRAGAAVAGVAADLGAGQAQFVAQHRRETANRRHADRNGGAVDLEGDVGALHAHARLSSAHARLSFFGHARLSFAHAATALSSDA